MLEVLIENAPDGLVAAKDCLLACGKGWSDKFNRAMKKCAKNYPEVVTYIAEL